VSLSGLSLYRADRVCICARAVRVLVRPATILPQYDQGTGWPCFLEGYNLSGLKYIDQTEFSDLTIRSHLIVTSKVKCLTSGYGQGFLDAAPSLWNALSHNTRNTRTFNTFKHQLKTFLSGH